ncbi:MAG: DNA gyrase inhibitor YacG [Hyphomicrobiales bacterium]|nr:DNA gyrase inhibitor YacG [Hyphomicrobiales bacterium]
MKPADRAPGGGKRQDRGGGSCCPLCGKTSEQATRPFCSQRCADIDLGRWLKGGYAVPGERSADDEE